MAKQTIGIGASANDGSGDPIRIAFDKVNDNFNELYNNGGTTGNTLIDLFDSNGNLDLSNKAHKISFLYNTEALLKSVAAGSYHGAIGHAHDTGSLYYAHGDWRKLLSDNSNNDITNYVDPLSKHVYLNNISNSETEDYVLATNADGTYTWVENAGGGGGGGSNSSYEDSDVDTHLNVSGANSNEVLQWSGSDYTWTALPSGGGGGLSNTEIGTVVDGHLNQSGASSNDILSWDGSDYAWISQSGGGSYNDNAVSAHLNVSGASTNEVLSWDGSDFAWVAQSGGGGSVAMADISDTTISNPQSNDILKYFGNDNTWRNVTFTPSYGDISQQPSNNADKALFENSFVNAATVLKVTHNGSSSYRFDQYGSADNPTIYVKAGTTVGFDLSDAGGTTHPFVIQTSGGADYNEGLVALDLGNYYTGANANAGIGGALFWKIPAGISGNYKYICENHSSMTGTIVVEAAAGGGGGGGGGASRVQEAETTASISDGASGNVEYATLGESFALQKVTVDKQCWVRIYSDTASRTADNGRTQGTDPADGSGVIAEFISTSSGTQEFKITPAIIGWLDDSETEVPVAIQNNSGSTGTVTVTIDALKLES